MPLGQFPEGGDAEVGVPGCGCHAVCRQGFLGCCGTGPAGALHGVVAGPCLSPFFLNVLDYIGTCLSAIQIILFVWQILRFKNCTMDFSPHFPTPWSSFSKKTKRCGRVMNSSVDCGGNILGINMGVAGAIFCNSKSQDRAPEGGHRSDYTNLLRMFERLHSPPKTPLGRLQRRGTDETSINSRGLRPGSQELLGHKVCSQEFTMCSRSIITQLFVIFHFIGYYDWIPK